MYEKTLEALGLTRGEAKVYLALNKLGEVTVGPIGKESKVSKSKMYDILDKLIAKGLVSYITRNGTKYFSTNDPQMILSYIQKKKDELEETQKEVEEIIQNLTLQRTLTHHHKLAEIYEGFHGLKMMREELMLTLKKNDELLVLGAPKIANEKWEAWFMDFHKRREAKGVGMRIIYNSNAYEFGEKRKQFKHTHVKYLPNNLISPNWIDIYNDVILFVFVLKEPLTFVIRDNSLAQSFKAYFEIVWKASKSQYVL